MDLFTARLLKQLIRMARGMLTALDEYVDGKTGLLKDKKS